MMFRIVMTSPNKQINITRIINNIKQPYKMSDSNMEFTLVLWGTENLKIPKKSEFQKRSLGFRSIIHREITY